MKRQINYEQINDLYIAWLNERDPFVQRQRKEEIRKRISKSDFLIYSIRFFDAFKAFRNIFSLGDLFNTIEEMQRQGEDISSITQKLLFIKTPEDVKIVSYFAEKENISGISNLNITFSGTNILQYGDMQNIGKKFPCAYIKNLKIEQLEQLMKSAKSYKGIPISLTINNIGQLSLEKLSQIEQFFDVEGIRIDGRSESNHAEQGECTPLNVRTYKRIRKVVDDEFLSKLYIMKKEEATNQFTIDYRLATQVIDKLARKVEKDYEAVNMPKFSDASKNASSLVCLLTGKAVCKGYAETLRNILSCVDVACTVIDGEDDKGIGHSWNEVRLGNCWYNVDVTYAKDRICRGEPSGDLFMADNVFFGERRQTTFDKGRKIGEQSLETVAMIGGHSKIYGYNQHHECRECMTPVITLGCMKKGREMEEISKHNATIILYIGSNVQQMRSSSKNISGIEH